MSSHQTFSAMRLHKGAGLHFDHHDCGRKEWPLFQSFVNRTYGDRYGINVWTMQNTVEKRTIYVGNPEANIQLHILHYDDHYATINSITGFLEKTYYCSECRCAFRYPKNHKCKQFCYRCRHYNCPYDTSIPEDDYLECYKCERFFKNQECFDNHKIKSKPSAPSTCEDVKVCSDCKAVYQISAYRQPGVDGRLVAHVCGEMYCATCRGIYGSDHVCFMKPIHIELASDVLKNTNDSESTKHATDDVLRETELRALIGGFGDDMDDLDISDDEHADDTTEENSKNDKKSMTSKKKKKKKPKNFKFLFFDFESMFDNDEHIPNLAIAHWRCQVCLKNENDGVPRDDGWHWDGESDHPVDVCRCGKDREIVIQGLDTKQKFCEWLFTDNHKDCIVLSHNGKAYDNIFVLNYLIKTAGIMPDVIRMGGKITCLSMRKMGFKMIDSLNFLTMPLSEFPKTFGLTEMKKGYFPFFFNTPVNQSYVGPIPPRATYGADRWNVAKRAEFNDWYDAQVSSGVQFDLQKELLEYCRSDVSILREGCLSFREIFMEASTKEGCPEDKGVDPFKECLTIASACSYVYRRNHMPLRSIALIPNSGYLGNTLQSQKALRWLYYLEKTRNIKIQHYGGGREAKVAGFKVDGLHGRTVFEFYGDFYHGNLRKYHQNSFQPLANKTMQELYDSTMDRERRIKHAGYTVERIWEMDYDVLATKADFLEKTSDFEFVEPLCPRDAYFGGRTGACRTMYKAGRNEVIKYFDVTSLYPYAMYDNEFPVGNPDIITNPVDQDIKSYFGLAKVTVLPPQDLYHPNI